MTTNGDAGEGTVCVVADRWPRVSSTFVAQELVGLEEQGLTLRLATFGRPDKVRHELFDRLQAPIDRLPRSPKHSWRYWRAWLKVRSTPGYALAKAMVRADRPHVKKPEKLPKYFGRAVILAAEMPDDVRVIYAHFLNLTTTIARYAAAITGLPLAASGHARDIWTAKEQDLRAKLEQMDWCATCTAPGAERLRELTDRPESIHLIYHGLLFDRFPSEPPIRPSREGSDSADPVRLLTVGRAVQKKGFDLLLEALAALPAGLAWRLDHIGPGELLPDLRAQAEGRGIADRVTWHGAQDQAFVIERYRESDLFVLPSREADDGDRDGLPNVLMEAQSQALACLSTRFSAIPELIVDGQTGVLVPPADAAALQVALDRLIRSPDERARLGEAGYKRVRTDFDARVGVRRIAELLRGTMKR